MRDATLTSARTANRVVTAVAVMLLFMCALTLNSLARSASTTLPAMPTASPVPSATPTTALQQVEYRFDYKGDAPSTRLDIWYASGPDNQHDTVKKTVQAGRPLTITVRLAPGTVAQGFANLPSEQTGQISCVIVVNSSPVAQSTAAGRGAGVHCRSIPISR